MNAAPEVNQAVAHLLNGGVIGLPTETVYGLAGDAGNKNAVLKIYAVKGRPANHPLIVHVANTDHALYWINCKHPQQEDRFWMLANAFWPGPLTMILPRNARAPDFASAGQSTIGIRVPSHPMALSLLSAFHDAGGKGLAAPSANRFGKVSPTTATHVMDDLGSDVDLILDGGDCTVGLESTIVDLSGNTPRILRPGAISALEISHCLDVAVAEGAARSSPQVSGSLASHYSPKTRIELVPAERLVLRTKQLTEEGKRVGHWTSVEQGAQRTRIASTDSKIYSRTLYAGLRALDSWGVDVVLIEKPPQTAEWNAVNDRLKRASSYG